MLEVNMIDAYSYNLVFKPPISPNMPLITQQEENKLIAQFKNNILQENCHFGKFQYISECSDPDCAYYRRTTNMRERFEEKIIKTSTNKQNIKILCYASFLLYQELRIALLLGDKISEIHFIDYAYNNFLTQPCNLYFNAFVEFMTLINLAKLDIKVFVHTNPDELKTSKIFQRTFDIICGIDVDYVHGNTNNRPIMKDIAKNTLQINGVMYTSQQNLDQVDLCKYEIMSSGNIKLIDAEDFIKPSYYIKYTLGNLFNKLVYHSGIIGLLLSTTIHKKFPITSIIMGTCCSLYALHKYIEDDDNCDYFNRQTKKFADLMK